MIEPARTPAEHRAAAEISLTRMTSYQPGTDIYRGLALNAIAHTLAAVAVYLEPPPVPDIPGLPPGWKLDTMRSAGGQQMWGWALTLPDGTRQASDRHRWGTSVAALAAGLAAADAIRQGGTGESNGRTPQFTHFPPESGMDGVQP